MLYSAERFLERYLIIFGKYTLEQKEGLLFLLNKLGNSKRMASPAMHAYVLATVKWETAHTFQPITEYGGTAYLRSKKYFPYYGRGYVQLTWEANYRKFGNALNIDLLKNPVLANIPGHAWNILEMGMTDNFGVQDADFTKYTLEDFINNDRVDFLNARKIINPRDYGSYMPIKDLADKFLIILQGSIVIPDPKPRR